MKVESSTYSSSSIGFKKGTGTVPPPAPPSTFNFFLLPSGDPSAALRRLPPSPPAVASRRRLRSSRPPAAFEFLPPRAPLRAQMCTKRATALAVDRLASLPKVCSSRTSSSSSGSIWALNPSRLIGSAAESYDLGVPNGSNGEHVPELEQSPDGVREKSRDFADTARGSLNPNGVYGSVVQSRNFNEHGRPYYGDSRATNWNGGMYRESYGGEYGNRPVVGNMNTGSYGDGSGGWAQKPSDFGRNPSPNAGYHLSQYGGQSPQNVNVHSCSGSVQGFERNPNMAYGQRGMRLPSELLLMEKDTVK
ncbi:hypothetical protein NL676_035337 [Syzygium grande]|nr:hypothetical protein NL676_035337 [Syzygium grande]